jgi:signal transduction histidine kinase
MSFGKISARFTASFLLLFFITAGALSIASVFYLRTSLTRSDRSFLDNRLLEFWAVYRSGGIDLIRRELSMEQLAGEDRLFALRLATPENRTVYFYAPSGWDLQSLDSALSQTSIENGPVYAIDSRAAGGRLELRSLGLQDGNRLQLLISSEQRRVIVARFSTGTILIVLIIAIPGLGLSLALSRRMVKPLSDLARQISEIRPSEIGTRSLSYPDAAEEIVLLTDSFNRMSERIARLIEGSRIGLDNIAHDLQTPITRLSQRAEMALQNPEDTDQMANALRICLEEAQHIDGIIKTTVEITRAENRIIPGRLEIRNLAELASDLVDLYTYAEPDGKRRITLDDPGEELPVLIRPDGIRQILANLLDNAIKFSPDSTPIRVELRRQDDRVRLSVIDGGPGISNEDLPHIWERMYRGDKSRSVPGSGLGLSLVKALAEAHGGRIEVSSSVGSGSRFTLILPLEKAE